MSVKNKKHWYIETDSSIDDSFDAVGAELVSPPLPLSDSLVTITTIFDWMQKRSIQTNDSTGLHVNVSIPGIEKKLDPVKLILFMGEDYATGAFNRLNNNYTEPQIKTILTGIKLNGRIPQTASDMYDVARRAISQGKNRTVNISKLSEGYIEFRALGGENYHLDAALVKKMVYRFVVALELACDPAAERNEYLKKLTALFSKVTTSMASNEHGNPTTVPNEIKRLANFSPIHFTSLYYSFDGADKRSKKVDLILLLDSALLTMKTFNTSLDLKERVFFKRLIKANDVSSTDIDTFCKSPGVQSRLLYQKEFGI